MKKLRCAVVGVGHLGKFHAEKYSQLENADLVAVCDNDKERCAAVASQYQVDAVFDYRQLLGRVDVVSVVVPTLFHFPVVKFFLENNIHVLVEKPITSTLTEASELISLAQEHGLILQVGHLERFNPVVTTLEKYIKAPCFIDAQRLSPFSTRCTDVNVILDLMVHDIDIISSLIKSPIDFIQAHGTAVITENIDIANARLQFENLTIANITASRVSPYKERKISIFQANTFVHVDLQNKDIFINQHGEESRTYFEKSDELMLEIKAFINSVYYSLPPVVSGEDGKRALELALHISQLVKPTIVTDEIFA